MIFAQGRREEEPIEIAWGRICLFSLSCPSLWEGSLHVSLVLVKLPNYLLFSIQLCLSPFLGKEKECFLCLWVHKAASRWGTGSMWHNTVQPNWDVLNILFWCLREVTPPQIKRWSQCTQDLIFHADRLDKWLLYSLHSRPAPQTCPSLSLAIPSLPSYQLGPATQPKFSPLALQCLINCFSILQSDSIPSTLEMWWLSAISTKAFPDPCYKGLPPACLLRVLLQAAPFTLFHRPSIAGREREGKKRR